MARKLPFLLAGMMCGIVSWPGLSHGETYLSMDYETGQTVGSKPVGAVAIRPNTNSATSSTQVVAGGANPAGGAIGHGVRIFDDDNNGVGLEYHFAASAAAQISAFRVDFDIARVAAGISGNEILYFGAGEYNASTALRMNTGAQRFFQIEFTGDGQANFVSVPGVDSLDVALLSGRNHVTIFVNDQDSQSLVYARPDNGLAATLPANSVAYWLNNNPVLTTQLDTAEATASGTVGTTANNFGRLGFVTNTGTTDVDWNVDNLVVSTITAPAAGGGTAHIVSNAADFNALPNLNAGDVVLLRSGSYGAINKTLVSTISDDATALSSPIVICAEVPGGVDVAAPSQITLQGRGITLAGLDFTSQSGMPSNGASTSVVWIIRTAEGSRHMRLTNLRFLNCNAGDDYGNWLLIEGFHHTIEYCLFEGKDYPNRNATIAFKTDAGEASIGTPRGHRLHHCYFGPREVAPSSLGDEANGYEAIRIGNSSSQAAAMNVTIESNVFYRASWRSDGTTHGEPEIISGKSKGNRILNNTFLESQGQICLRHGDDCVVDGNFVFGGGYYSADGTQILQRAADPYQGGIRVIGQGHIVRNNYLANLTGTGFNAALCLVAGVPGFNDGDGNTGDSSYEAAHNAQAYNNTFLNCKEMNLGYAKDSTTTEQPAGVKIYNNAWQGSGTSNGVVRNSGFHLGGSGGNYLYNSGGVSNLGWNGLGGNYTSTASPGISEDFDNYKVPIAGSPLLGAVNTTLVASNDVRNLARPSGAASRDIGCFEKEVTGSGRRPLWRSEVGPVFAGGPSNTYPQLGDTVPGITTASLPNATVGEAYSQALAASGGDGTLTWSVSGGALPAGLALSSGGVISGTPTAAETANFTVQVSDADGDADTQALTLISSSPWGLNPAKPPSGNFDLTRWYITLPIDNSGGFSGTAMSIPTAQLAGYSRPPYFYTAADGAMVFAVPYNGAIAGSSESPRSELRETLPSGQLFNWTPASNGGTHILDAVCAVNAVGNGKVAFGQIHAKEPNIPTVILRYDGTTSPARIYVTVKKYPTDPISQDTLFFDGVPLNAPIAYQLKMVGSAGSLMFYCTVNGVTKSVNMYANSPAWLTATEYFKAGAYYTVPANGETAKVSFYKLKVTHTSGTPSITTASLPNGTAGSAYSQALAATGGDGALTWSLAGGTLPAGLSLNADGVLSGTPTGAGTGNFTVQASDTDGDTATRALSLIVSAGGGSSGKFAIAGASVSASANDGHLPANTVDGDLGSESRWSAQGDGQWIRYDLGAIKNVQNIKIAWYQGNTRISSFDVQISNDGTNWTDLLTDHDSSGTTAGLEPYDFADTNGRYVRILGHGNSVSQWNSILETEIYGTVAANGPSLTRAAFRRPQGGENVDVDVYGAGSTSNVEGRRGRTDNAHTLRLEFDQNVTAGEVTVEQGVATVSSVQFSGGAATVVLNNVEDRQKVVLKLHGFANGSGPVMADQFLTLRFMAGDVSRDGAVNAVDLAMSRDAYGRNAGQSGYNAAADTDGDGAVNAVDLTYQRFNYGFYVAP